MNPYEYWLAALSISDRKKTLLCKYMKSAEGVYYYRRNNFKQVSVLK